MSLLRYIRNKSKLPRNLVQSLEGQVALVTGAASGIGNTTAWELVKQGANVCLVDTDRKRGEETALQIYKKYGPGRAVYCKADVADSFGMEAAFLSTLDLFSSLDIVINTYGVMNETHWTKEVDVNVKGVINATQLGCKYMAKENGKYHGGVVINIASILGLQSCAQAPIYVGTKHFVIGYTRSMGDPSNFKRTGVRVMAMCPGICTNDLLLSNDIRAKEIRKDFQTLSQQLPEFVSKDVIQMIENGQSGSVWISENNENPGFEVQFSDLFRLRKHDKNVKKVCHI